MGNSSRLSNQHLHQQKAVQCASKSLTQQIASNTRFRKASCNQLLFRDTQRDLRSLCATKQFVAYNKHCQYELKGKEHSKKIQLENEKYKNYRVYSISNLFLSPSGNRFQNKKARRNN